MKIVAFGGEALEKAQPNTSEDFFNRSYVTYIEEGKEKTLYVLYLRHYEEDWGTFTPLDTLSFGERTYAWMDVCAIAYLLTHAGAKKQKRVYLNTIERMQAAFETLEAQQLADTLRVSNHSFVQ
ncbi:MAG: hypothetical protein ACRC5C_07510 [Bacilli bacterium]